MSVDFPPLSCKPVEEEENNNIRKESLESLEAALLTIRERCDFTLSNPSPKSNIANDVYNILLSLKKNGVPLATRKKFLIIREFISSVLGKITYK